MNLGRDPVERKEERRRKLKGGEMTLRSGRVRGEGEDRAITISRCCGEREKDGGGKGGGFCALSSSSLASVSYAEGR